MAPEEGGDPPLVGMIAGVTMVWALCNLRMKKSLDVNMSVKIYSVPFSAFSIIVLLAVM